MFIARLKVLGINALIGFNSYHDDGYVDSIKKHLSRLNKKYPNQINWNEPAIGMCIGGKRLFRTHIHIFYLDQKSDINNIRTRAHEETHVLDYFDRLDILEKIILLEQKVKINFNELREDNDDCLIDRQVRAELGAIYALKTRGVNLNDLKNCPEYFDFAREYYEKHKLEKKTT